MFSVKQHRFSFETVVDDTQLTDKTTLLLKKTMSFDIIFNLKHVNVTGGAGAGPLKHF